MIKRFNNGDKEFQVILNNMSFIQACGMRPFRPQVVTPHDDLPTIFWRRFAPFIITQICLASVYAKLGSVLKEASFVDEILES